ncbi:MAG: hypothetical protein F2589_01645 [Actinobacteria bacterium]|uniref:Unannotated protein n=1 Tax=freshwater metagenome TaxID=449393 RepID=A0A6J6CR94_9ZZZZ|nr:hypothetical protein [Actinomycetota bacterium]MTA98658.1 hypothetical protein [Actinomycetota bacterium]
MSILNLNTPQGNRSGGKKSVKMWLGAGLLVAVLGIGSTLAANITINSPEGNTEFGQGVTQTVYCGGTKSVTITPISSYKNTVIGSGSGEVTELTSTIKYVTDLNSSPTLADIDERITIYTSSGTDVPRWKLSKSETKGWWLSNSNSTSVITSNPTIAQAVAAGYFFAPQTSEGYFKRGNSSTNMLVVTRNYVAPVAGPTTPASFKVGGVLISNIPPQCEGVNFVISSYTETGTVQTFISKDSDAVTEVAALWTADGPDADVVLSKSRKKLLTTSLVNAIQNTDSLEIEFYTNTAGSTALGTDKLYKLVVETQENAFIS